MLQAGEILLVRRTQCLLETLLCTVEPGGSLPVVSAESGSRQATQSQNDHLKIFRRVLEGEGLPIQFLRECDLSLSGRNLGEVCQRRRQRLPIVQFTQGVDALLQQSPCQIDVSVMQAYLR